MFPCNPQKFSGQSHPAFDIPKDGLFFQNSYRKTPIGKILCKYEAKDSWNESSHQKQRFYDFRRYQFKASKIALKIYNKIPMQANKIQEGEAKKRSYSKIPIKKRMMLVKLVLKRGVSLSEAIQKLGLKITTARFIINKYQETGTFPHRKFKRRTGKKEKMNACKEEFFSEEEEEEESLGEKDKEKVKLEEAASGMVKTEEDGKMLLVYYPWLMI